MSRGRKSASESQRKKLTTGGARVKCGSSVQKKTVPFAFAPKRKPRGKPFPKGNKIGHRFKKGESGNPSGLPGTNLSERIARAVLAKYEPQIVEGLGAKLRKGDIQAFSIVSDRADGKLKEKRQIDHTGADGGPIETRSASAMAGQMNTDVWVPPKPKSSMRSRKRDVGFLLGLR